jgi:hypothetical protein
MDVLKGMIWNSEGFKDPNKHLFVNESIREQKLDFIALLETGRSNFSVPFLNHLSTGLDFHWLCLPPHGRSGGIPVGINSATLQMANIDTSDYFVKIKIKCRNDGFEWVLIPVYGAAQESHKPEFLVEMVRMCEQETLPMLVGGDSTSFIKGKKK